MIAGSRIIDARHHPFDVLFGSALGILCGWAAYRQYFPPVSHTWEKGRAYPIRSWGVPLRRPNGTVGTDGEFYSHSTSRVDRTANTIVDDEEDRQALVGMEPIRSQGFSEAEAPSFRQFQQRTGRPGHSHSGSEDDTDYDHARMKAGNTLSAPGEGPVRSQKNIPTNIGGNNPFRAQIEQNQTMRTVTDGDLAHQRPLK